MNMLQLQLFAGLAVLLTLASGLVALRVRRRLCDVIAVLHCQETDLTELRGDLDAATLRAADLARRVAWLESRARPAARRPRSEEPLDERRVRDEARGGRDGAAATRANFMETGVIEQRHRVLTLARRGMRGAAIAEALGMLHGEVELIINLGRIG